MCSCKSENVFAFIASTNAFNVDIILDKSLKDILFTIIVMDVEKKSAE